MRKILSILLTCIWCFVNGQDAHFTVFENAISYYNPATSGLLIEGDYRISNSHKRQWKKLIKPARATNLGFDIPMLRYSGMEQRNAFMGFGINMFSERFGSSKFSRSNMNMSLMGGIKSGDHKFSTGLQFGTGKQTVNPDGASWDSQFDGYEYDPSLPTNEAVAGKIKQRYLDLGAGFAWLWHKKNGFMMQSGVSYLHANNPNVQLDGFKGFSVEPKITAHSKIDFPFQPRGVKRMSFALYGLYGMQGPHVEMLAGGSMRIFLQEASQYTYMKGNTSLELGAAYRNGDAVAIIANYHRDNVNIGFSYDITTSSLGQTVGYRGGAELSITFYGALKYFHLQRGF